MRRHIYIIMVMLLGCIGQLRAQDAVSIVGYEYWFDTNFDARVKVDSTSTPGNLMWINEKYIDASGLSEGVHRMYLRALNSKNLWSNINVNAFYIDREPETRPALKDVRRYRYMFNDGTMKYGELTTPGQSITDQVIADAPDVANVFIDKSATTFTFPASVEEKSEVTMTRDVEYNFALQYENDQNGWCPPVVTSFTQTQTLTKDATYIPFEKYATVQKPHRGDFQPIAFEIFEGGEYALKADNGVFTALYKQVTSGETTNWVKFAEVSPSELVEGYREYLDAGSYFGVIYTPEQYEDGKEVRAAISLMEVCEKPEIIVDGDKVTIGGLEDATYYYTIDGSTPTTESTQYTESFTVTESCVVKAIAVKNGSYNSDMAVALVNLGGDVEAGSKTARVDAKFEEGVLTLSCDTKNAIIYYGINQTPSNIYSEPVQLTDNRPVIFYAQAPGYEESRRDTLEISYFRCSIRAYSDR
ncbi:MAG: chitobiase/beta-hexosaminidase C-terminal domain-containing protein, partial [Prevotellaceae bacterium]|nr:chitobiase/beta-hexosaminidase C-terminal domain-containing protein [Prevotellaceae bacterium]